MGHLVVAYNLICNLKIGTKTLKLPFIKIVNDVMSEIYNTLRKYNFDKKCRNY